MYALLDPSHPRALLAGILAEVNAQVVLADERALAALPDDAPVLRMCAGSTSPRRSATRCLAS